MKKSSYFPSILDKLTGRNNYYLPTWMKGTSRTCYLKTVIGSFRPKKKSSYLPSILDKLTISNKYYLPEWMKGM